MRMERLTDKLLLGICCAASAVAFSPNAESVAWLLLAFALSLGTEAVGGAAAGAASAARRTQALGRTPNALRWAFAALPCVAALGFPRLAACLPLAAYDLVRLALERAGRASASASSRSPSADARAAEPEPAGAAAIAPVTAAPFALALLAVITPWLGTMSARALPMGQLALTLGLDLAAVLLSWRTAVTSAQRARNQRERDRLSAQSQQLAAQNRDLVDRRAYEVRVATLEERARIAREIHDNVGHLLTRACLQVEALRVVHEGEPRVQADFADVSRTLAEALTTVRASVHNLRDDAVDLGAQMHQLAAETAAGTGLAVDVDVSAERVPADVASCFLAVLRETAANTLRHSNATRLRAQCLEQPALYQLVVTDNGTGGPEVPVGRADARAYGPDSPAGEKRGGCAAGLATAGAAGAAAAGTTTGTGHGMGLSSMRERVEALGGTFSAGPQANGGFRVFASIPKRS